MLYKNIFFDFDGTISKSGPGIFKALSYMFERLGLETPEEKILRKFVGPPIVHTLKEYGVKVADYEKAYAEFREYYEKKGIYEMSLYPGIIGILKGLKKEGANIYIATGKRKQQAVYAAEYLKIKNYFKRIFGAEPDKNIFVKKDILKKAIETIGYFPEKPVIVGDRGIDLKGGKENGFAAIGVLYGYGDEDEIKKEKPDHIAKDINELKAILLG